MSSAESAAAVKIATASLTRDGRQNFNAIPRRSGHSR
jgi:hypothetical protein